MQVRSETLDIAYRKKATLVVMLSSFLVVFHITVINVSFPQIQTAFGADVETIKWVLTAMLVSTSVLLPLSGWLGRAAGLKNMFFFGLLIYTVVTFLSGSAWSINSLIIYMVIQGVGMGILMSVAVAMVAVLYPAEERGKGMAYWSIANSLGGSVGPLIGGYVADNFSWRLIFYINTPLALFGLIVCILFLKKDVDRVVEKFDYVGFALISLAIVTLLLALSEGRVEGWNSNYILGLLTTFVISFAAWIFVEMKAERPLVEFALFKDKFFVAGSIITFIIGISLYGTNFLMPLFMQKVLGYSVLRSAVIIVIGVMISVFFGRMSGPIADKYTPRLPLLIGITLWALFCYVFSFNDTRVSFMALGLVMVIRGVGYGLSLPPMMSGALTTLSTRLTTMASGMLNLSFTLGGMFGIAVLGTLLDKQELTHYANYASDQNYSSPATVSAISQLQSFFSSIGHSPANAKGLAISVLEGVIRREAVVSAFQDGFIFITMATLIALVPAVLMGKARRSP